MNVDEVQGEREIPRVGDFGANFRGRNAFTGLLLLGATVAFGVWIWDRAQDNKVSEVKEELNPVREQNTGSRLLVMPEDPEPEIITPEVVAYVPPPKPKTITKTIYLPPKVIPVNKSASGSSVGKGNGGNRGNAQYAQGNQTTTQGGSGDFIGKPANAPSAGAQNGPTTIQTAVASQLQSRDMLITAGTYGGCVLSVELITSVAGMAVCLTTDDIKSSDGTNVLLPRASKVIGPFDSETTQGIRRIDVQWARIETPSGVVIDIDSPATGPLGATGIAALVDNHLSERIVGALMLSFIDIAVGEATSGGNNTADVIIGGTASATGSLARDIFKETAGIKPTLFAHRGAQVGFIFTRDLDFSKVQNVR